MATLYLNAEGILHPPYSSPHLDSVVVRRLSQNAALFEDVLQAFPLTTIVLHSWFVYDAGYKRALRCLPPLTRARVIGTTFPGNRLHRFRSSAVASRRDWLRSDLKRRAPRHPVLLDSDWSQVLPSLYGSSLIVEKLKDLSSSHTIETLFRLLLQAEADASEDAIAVESLTLAKRNGAMVSLDRLEINGRLGEQ